MPIPLPAPRTPRSSSTSRRSDVPPDDRAARRLAEAFAIAERLGLPEAIVDDARSRLTDAQRAFEATLAQIRESEGATVDNFITPSRLTNLEKRTIKDAFHLIARVQDQVLERYKAAIL